MCPKRLIEPTVAWQNSEPVSCKMHAFLQNAISFALLYSGFVWINYNIQALYIKKSSVYLFDARVVFFARYRNRKTRLMSKNCCIMDWLCRFWFFAYTICSDLFVQPLSVHWLANSAKDRLIIFCLLFPEKRAWHLMQIVSSGQETICMKCQNIFSGKNEKNILQCRLLIFFPACYALNIEYCLTLVCHEKSNRRVQFNLKAVLAI